MSPNAAVSLDSYSKNLAAVQARLTGASQPWLAQQRREAAVSLGQLGFPQRRHEAWRYTSVERLLKQDFVPAAGHEPPAIDSEALLLSGQETHRAVFVNGRFVPGLSSLGELPHGVTAGSLQQQIADNPILPARWIGKAAGAPAHAFTALNTATLEDGLFIHVAQGRRVDRPIEVLHLTSAPVDAVMTQSRSLVLLEAGARATLVERFASVDGSQYFSNNLSEIILMEGADFEHFRLQEESAEAFHLHSLFVNQQARSRYRDGGYALGGAWSRTELTIDLLGRDAAADLDGLYLAGTQQLTDVHIDIRHAVPGCESHALYKGLLHGRGRAVFDGRIEVSPGAVKTSAHLHNHNMLLSRNAEVDTKPQLEINADDVQCSHGTTVGQLDPAQLFYMRSRGIDAVQARHMLCAGFAGEVLDRCRILPLRERIEAGITDRLLKAPDAGGEDRAG